jgi:hypothetical protein
MWKQTLVALCLVPALASIAACGGGDSSPFAPSNTPSSSAGFATSASLPTISGTWDGTHEMQFFGERTFSNIRITIEQQGRTITKGEWALTSPGWDIRGNLTGRIEGDGPGAVFVGSTTIIGETVSGTGRCNGTAAISSEANFNSSVMRLVGPNITFSDCRNGQVAGIVWIFHR